MGLRLKSVVVFLDGGEEAGDLPDWLDGAVSVSISRFNEKVVEVIGLVVDDSVLADVVPIVGADGG